MFELPKLNYDYGDLEPNIDAKTMEIHYTKHHQAYVDKLNAAVAKYPDLANMGVEDLLKNLGSLKVDDADRTAIRNHGGGHFNHSLFWKYLDPSNKKDELIVKEITSIFGSVEDFKKEFSDSAAKIFGSGWCWLVRDNKTSKLVIQNLPNQDAPIMSGLQPVFGLDVWEHAYYIQYKWERAKYVENWWNVLKLLS